MRSIIILFLSLVILHSAKAQNNYQLNKTREILLISAGSLVLAGGMLMEKQGTGLTDQQIANLNPTNSLDMGFSPKNYSLKAKEFSDILYFSEMGISAAIVGIINPGEQPKETLIMLLEGMIINQAIVDWVKIAVNRPRPFLHTDPMLYDPYEVDARRSFYSGHTAGAAFYSMFVAGVLTDAGIGKKGTNFLIASAFPIAMGFSRMKAGKHYFTDVMVGAIAGTVIAWKIRKIHYLDKASSKINLLPSLNRITLSYKIR